MSKLKNGKYPRRLVADIHDEDFTPEYIKGMAAKDGLTIMEAVRLAITKTFPHWFPNPGDAERFKKTPSGH